jgi:hypothetical protein
LSFFPEPLYKFLPKLLQIALDEGFKFVAMKGIDNSKGVKIHRNVFKIFSRTTLPKAIKLGTNYSWVKGMQISFANKGPGPLERGGIHKNLNMV